ncbi:MAG: hypothetical protein ACOZBH_02995 [Patescibacteria group bacterium]
MSRTLKVFLSCLIGSGIGTFIALSVNSWFWWTGALVGGLIGYLSYEFKKVVAAIPKAWRAASNWTPNRLFWKTYLAVGGYIFHLAFASLMVCLIMTTPGSNLHVWITLSAVAAIFFGVTLGAGVVGECSDEQLQAILKLSKKLYLNYNVVSVTVLLAYHLIISIRYVPRAVWVAMRSVGRAGMVLGRFFKHLFLFIHSEIRLLCAIDSLCGVISGYLISRAYSLSLLAGVLVGMAAGALLGLVNYQLVSVRVLKVAPKRNN